MKPIYDRAFVDASVKRLESIAADAKPVWGSMSAPQMMAHMQTAIGYSLGKVALTPPEGSRVMQIVAKVFLNGWVKFPHGLARPKLYDAGAPTATVADVKAELEDFLGRLGSDDFNPPPHPSLGDFGVKGWCKLHCVHLDHHLRQFGA